MENKYIQAMSDVYSLKEEFGIQVRGNKKYTQVVTRVEVFRRAFGGELGIQTDILLNDGKYVIVKATIADKNGYVVSSGLAEEIRGGSPVNKTSALENCETSAIGRALASMGLHGGQYASADEMEGIDRKEEALKNQPPPEPSAVEETKPKSNEPAPWPEKWEEDDEFPAWVENQLAEKLMGNLQKLRDWRKIINDKNSALAVARLDVILKRKGIVL